MKNALCKFAVLTACASLLIASLPQSGFCQQQFRGQSQSLGRVLPSVYQRVQVKHAATPSLAQRSFSMQPLPSAGFSYGFDQQPRSSFAGRKFSRGFGGLPATSTASVNLNICDSPSRSQNEYYRRQYNEEPVYEPMNRRSDFGRNRVDNSFANNNIEEGNFIENAQQPMESASWQQGGGYSQGNSWSQP